jgi:hypothetical protein
MNVNSNRTGAAFAAVAIALLAVPVSARATQYHKPRQVAEKIVPVYNAGVGIPRGRLYLLENRALTNMNTAENFQNGFNIDY